MANNKRLSRVTHARAFFFDLGPSWRCESLTIAS